MENKLINKTAFAMLLIGSAMASLFYSCKENDGGDDGQPQILSVYQLDTVERHRDSTFSAAEPNVLLVINGLNIGNVKAAYFNEFLTSFNTNYNTSTKLIIRVPPQAPTDSTASNTIRLVTSSGEATFEFKIIAKPAIFSFDKRTFGTGRGDFTFTGKNFADMIKVVAFREADGPEIVTDSVVCEIISKKSTELVVRIPDNNISRLTLHFTNSSGTTKAPDVFINSDLAFHFFTESFGKFMAPDGAAQWTGDSWANPVTVNTEFAYAGDTSISVVLNANGYSWFGFTDWYPQFKFDSLKYKYVTFSIKGAAVDMPLWLTSEVLKGGGGGIDKYVESNRITVFSGVWNYYRIAIADLDMFYDGASIPRIGFRPQGLPSDLKLYVDDYMLVP